MTQTCSGLLESFKKVKLIPVTHYSRVTFPNDWFCQISETPYQVSTATLHPGRLTHYTQMCYHGSHSRSEYLNLNFSFKSYKSAKLRQLETISVFFFFFPHYHDINDTYLTVYPILICILINVLAFYFGTGRTSAFRIICDSGCQRLLYVSLHAEISHEPPSAVVII